MARTSLSEQDLQEVRELAAGWGKIVAKRAFGPDGPGPGVDLSAMERLAGTAAAGLIEGTLQTLLEQLAQDLDAQQPCPACGAPCPVQRETRDLHLTGGQQVAYREPVCHCPACRRDFFPQPTVPAPGRPRLQPRTLPPDP